ncbi:hypothetical protein C922_02476 [Plasmodium inui San Antonio 1]|uniref:Uncharacterized protein n=1 Tax=Plasmodium inui San Antonio 1 TaxID=1237626 RepID=W7APJ2_9APIC|nr:hypothetical protein C922_02476 [Plasmodium inui San Antonio 1]EUD67326.1 hypothetical protein C922_02476 [Plasmodium inui San Antonio 1]
MKNQRRNTGSLGPGPRARNLPNRNHPRRDNPQRVSVGSPRLTETVEDTIRIKAGRIIIRGKIPKKEDFRKAAEGNLNIKVTKGVRSDELGQTMREKRQA